MNNKFEKILQKHEFVLVNKIFEDNVPLYAAPRDIYEYKNPNYQGKVVVWVYRQKSKDQTAFHYFKQSNGITAPSQLDTAPQLDRNLTSHYIDKKYD